MSFLKQTGKAAADVIPGLGRLTFDDDAGTVFITSGTGVIGYRVAMSLLEAGHKKVRVGFWEGERTVGPGLEDEGFAARIAVLVQEKGGEIVDFDWKDETTYHTALKGCKTVFCTIPHLDDWQTVFPAFLNVCKDLKVKHFVKLSFLRNNAGSEYRKNVAFVKFHSSCDDFVENAPKSSDFSYTILCTSHIMATPLLCQGKGLSEHQTYVTASYGMGVNYVSPNDVADAVVVVLMSPNLYRNKVYNLTGPGPVFDSDVAKLLSKAYGTEITHVQLEYHEYEKEVKAHGLPEWLVKDAAEMEKMKASGIDELSSSIPMILKRLLVKHQNPLWNTLPIRIRNVRDGRFRSKKKGSKNRVTAHLEGRDVHRVASVCE